MMGRHTGRQQPAIYLFQPRRADPGESISATDQSGRDAGCWPSCAKPDGVSTTAIIGDLRRSDSSCCGCFIVGYCYGIRVERRLCDEVELHTRLSVVLSSRSDDKYLTTRLSPGQHATRPLPAQRPSFSKALEAVVRSGRE